MARSSRVLGRRGLGGEEPVGRGGGGPGEGGLKVNGLVEEPVAEENHQGEEPELEVAGREQSVSGYSRGHRWGALRLMGVWWGGDSLSFARGPGFVGADDEEREEDGKEAAAGREKITYNEEMT